MKCVDCSRGKNLFILINESIMHLYFTNLFLFLENNSDRLEWLADFNGYSFYVVRGS